MSPSSLSHRFVVAGLVAVMLLSVQACSPIGVPAQSATEKTLAPTTVVDEKPTTVPDTGYPAPSDSSTIAPTPQPTEPPMPSETPFPTRVFEKGGQDVVIPGGNLVVSLPEGWYASSLPDRMDIRNFENEEGAEPPQIGDKRIVIQLTLPNDMENKSPATLIQELYDHEVNSAANNGVDAATIHTPEPCSFGDLQGFSFLETSGPGFFTAYVADPKGNGVGILISPTTSLAFEEALKILTTMRFK